MFNSCKKWRHGSILVGCMMQFLHDFYGVEQCYGRSHWLHLSVYMYVEKCTGNKRLNTVVPIFAHRWVLNKKVRLLSFIQIANVNDYFLQGQTFKSSTLASLYVTSSQTVTDRTLLVPIIERCIWQFHMFHWHIYIWQWPIPKVRSSTFWRVISCKLWQIQHTVYTRV